MTAESKAGKYKAFEGQGHEDNGKPPSLLSDIRLIFSTILTDPGSSLAYGADSVIAVTVVLMVHDYRLGAVATLLAAGVILSVYLLAVLVYNRMTRQHVHPILGGGAFVSATLTAHKIRHHPRLKKALHLLGMGGTASLLSDFPATQALSVIAGVEALYFIPVESRLRWALGFVIFLSVIQRYGLANLARYMIWPVLAFYGLNLIIQVTGLVLIFTNGWQPPELLNVHSENASFWPLALSAIANGATLVTGVEVGYSSVNFPFHKGRAIRVAMWILYLIVLFTYGMQMINFLGLGTTYDALHHRPVPIEIARTVGGIIFPERIELMGYIFSGMDLLATPFGFITTLMLLLAAQTAQSDFPLEILRASRSRFFPRGVGDTAWRRTRPAPVIGGHEGVYNPRATMLLGALSLVIIYFFPSSHKIESMYGLAVITAVSIDMLAYMIRQIRARRVWFLTIPGFIAMVLMLINILYNKFLVGAWFVVLLMALYMIVFLASEAIYDLWQEKLNLAPLELALWYPAFQGKEVDRKNMVLVSNFHPGVIHFLKNYSRSSHMPLVVHFQTDLDEAVPQDAPPWFQNVRVNPGVDTISAITRFVRRTKPERVHLIPLMVTGIDPVRYLYFGNSIERLKNALSYHVDLQVEYNRERVKISGREIILHIFPSLSRFFPAAD
ncbi:MAG: KUP/HAK/KT family potassium transporter [Leptospirales bacterium]|nr:KUP/HAK/KT family potassium transporter [Leptospirales bacterium]